MKIYWNTNGFRCDENGLNTLDADMPKLHYGEKPTWQIAIMTGTAAATITDIATWRASVDKDFSSTTTPMCRTLSTSISVSQNVVSVPIDAFTSNFLAGVNSLEDEYGDAWFELWGYDTNAAAVFYMRIPILVSGSQDPQGGTAPTTTDAYLTEAQTRALVSASQATLENAIKAPNVYQFSVDGSTNWHDTFSSSDCYYRERKDITGSTWGATMPLGKSGVVIDNVNYQFTTTEGQAATVTFTKTTLGIASDAEPNLSLWNVSGSNKQQINTACYIATWSTSDLTITYYTTWIAGTWIIKFS